MKILKRGILIAATLTLLAIVLVSCLSGGKMMSITVTPATSIIAQGTTQQFAATATLADNQTVNWTTAVTWTSSDLTKATISNAAPSIGLATSPTPTLGGTIGTTIITATDPLNNLSSTAQITVYQVQSIAVTPTNPPNITPGQTQQFTATATLTDNITTQDLTTYVTWISSNPSVTIDTTGLAQPVSAGTTTTTDITAKDPITGITSLGVTLTVQ